MTIATFSFSFGALFETGDPWTASSVGIHQGDNGNFCSTSNASIFVFFSSIWTHQVTSCQKLRVRTLQVSVHNAMKYRGSTRNSAAKSRGSPYKIFRLLATLGQWVHRSDVVLVGRQKFLHKMVKHMNLWLKDEQTSPQRMGHFCHLAISSEKLKSEIRNVLRFLRFQPQTGPKEVPGTLLDCTTSFG